MEKDYSLLRPFDLEAAKRGEKICWYNDAQEPKYFVVTPAGNVVASFYEDKDENVWGPQDFRMAPLAWVEGRPVYRGDSMYKIANEYKVECVVVGFNEEDEKYLKLEDKDGRYIGTEYASNYRGYLTWQKPKTKREVWVNIYRGGNAFYYDTETKANLSATELRLACVKVEWEE